VNRGPSGHQKRPTGQYRDSCPLFNRYLAQDPLQGAAYLSLVVAEAGAASESARILKWWPNPSGALSPPSISNTLCKRPTAPRPFLVAPLRCEGLYSWHLVSWRRVRSQGIQEALAPRIEAARCVEVCL